MASIIQKLVRRGDRRRRRPDGKVHGITDAGIRLLAQKDFESISMAKIAREAGCSVGALYARFPEKNSYLYHLVASAFRDMARRAETELEVRPTKHLSRPSLVRHVVEHVVDTMTNARAAGVIRATIKLSTVKPITIELFEDYRTALSKSAVAVLAPRMRDVSTGAIRLGMQMLIAIVTDAVQQPRPGPMVAGSRRMKDALTQLLAGYLGVTENNGWAGEEADGEDEADDDGTENCSANSTDAVFDPDLRVMRKAKGPPKPSARSKIVNATKSEPGAAARNAKTGSPTEPPVVKPSSVPKGPPDHGRPKRKHRVI